MSATCCIFTYAQAFSPKLDRNQLSAAIRPASQLEPARASQQPRARNQQPRAASNTQASKQQAATNIRPATQLRLTSPFRLENHPRDRLRSCSTTSRQQSAKADRALSVISSKSTQINCKSTQIKCELEQFHCKSTQNNCKSTQISANSANQMQIKCKSGANQIQIRM